MPTSASRRVWEGKAGNYNLNIGDLETPDDALSPRLAPHLAYLTRQFQRFDACLYAESGF